MSEEYISLLANKFSVEHTTLPDAMAMEEYLRKQDRIFDVQCYRTKTNIEEINFFIEARIPQRPVCDIHDREKIAIVFLPDGHLPLVWPLRQNFPLLSHMVSYCDLHPFICLYDAPIADVKRSWTPQEFLQRIFMWLENSAVGTLHRDSQPLENIFLNSPYGNIILPEKIYEITKLECWAINKDSNNIDTYIMRDQESLDTCAAYTIYLDKIVDFKCNHNVTHPVPRSFFELEKVINPFFNLRDSLKNYFSSLPSEELYNKPVVCVIKLQDESSEQSQVYAFVFPKLVEFLQHLKIAELYEGKLGKYLGYISYCGDFDIKMLNVFYDISKEQLKKFNKILGDDFSGILVGCGTLGEQILGNFIHSGYGSWTVFDNDLYLPHNFSRHQLPLCYVGWNKAIALSNFYKSYNDCITIKAIAEDASNSSFLNSVQSFDIIIDASTSIAVQRNISQKRIAKKATTFLSLDGYASTLFCAKNGDNVSLNDLEAFFYRELNKNIDLAEHFSVTDDTMSYGYGCRDKSFKIEYSKVLINAGILCEQIREFIQKPFSGIFLNQIEPSCSVTIQKKQYCGKIKEKSANWEVSISNDIVNFLKDVRIENLPKETGGILVGFTDTVCKEIHIVDASAMPSDSTQGYCFFERGTAEIKEFLQKYEKLSGGIIHYLGEWHSHPAGSSNIPSEQDLSLHEYIATNLSYEGFPAIMIIVADELKIYIQEKL